MPELAPPPPPPRVVERFPDEPVPTIVPSPGENALLVPPEKPPARPPSKPEPPAKPEPDPVPVEPERPPVTQPALTLRPAPGGAATQTEASIRTLLETAQKNLQRVNFAALNADGQAQFVTARRFKEQAEDALKVGNLLFASKLADKAATMAAVLVR
jgi:hypothetical protein